MKIIKYIFFSFLFFFMTDMVYADNLNNNDINIIEEKIEIFDDIIINLNYSDNLVVNRK